MTADASLIRVAKRGGVPVASAPGAVVADSIRFRVSNEEPDTFGDVVVQDGLSWPDALPAVADHSHTLDATIGDWQNVERAGRETFATLRLLPPGASRMADLVRALHVGGFPVASSIYFDIHRNDIEPLGRSADGPKRYRRGRVREVTITQFPANTAAVAVARSLGFHDAEIAALSRTEAMPASINRSSSAVAAAPGQRGRTMTPISEQITAAQTAYEATQASFDQAREAQETDPSEANLVAVQRATDEADRLLRQLQTLRGAEAMAVRRASATNGPAAASPLPVARQVADLAAPALLRRRTIGETAPGTRLAQLVMCAGIAKDRRRSLDAVVQECYGEVPELMSIARTAVGAADTTTAGWAAELVRSETRALLDVDPQPDAVWARLAALGTSLNFAGGPSIAIPQMNIGMATQGAWVGEGGVIPLAKGALTTKRLYRYKLAGIVPMTKELQRTSDPSAVEVMRRLLMRWISNLLDVSMLDSVAEVTGVRPAGLLNGVTPLTGTAGGGYNAIVGDLKQINDAFIAANVGARPILLVGAGKAFTLRAMQNALGQFVFPDGSTALLGYPIIATPFVSATQAIAIDAALFATAIDEMEIDLNDTATVTMANADLVAPTQAGATAGGGALGTRAGEVVRDGGIPVSGGTGASTTGYTAMSFWQTWSAGLRLVLPASFGTTRAGAVQVVNAITW